MEGVEKIQAELETIVLLLPTLSRTRRDVRNIVISKSPCLSQPLNTMKKTPIVHVLILSLLVQKLYHRCTP